MEEETTVSKTCPICGKVSLVTVNIDAYRAWLNREGKIQDLLPGLTSSEREILMTGTCDPCWDIMWKEDEE